MTGGYDGELAEEAWEAEIGDLLGGLPAIDPPSGFMARAIDHRPLYAGRTLVGLVAASVLAATVVVLTGAATRAPVAPEVDDLARRHDSVVRAGVLGSLTGQSGPSIDTPVEMPNGFERAGQVTAADLQQAVYARGDEAVSIFVQDGPVAWGQLPAEGLTEFDGMRAWVDDDRRIVVVETTGDTVTIVGLSGDEVAAAVADLPRSGPSFGRLADETVRAITGQLGFPD